MSNKVSDQSLAIDGTNSSIDYLNKRIDSAENSFSGDISSVKKSVSDLESKTGESLSSIQGQLGGVSDFVQQSLDSTVRVKSFSPGKTATGSGAIITSQGYIVTNNHVVENASSIEVKTYDNKIFSARLIGRIVSPDLAVLKIDGNFQPLKFEQSLTNIKTGSEVAALGSPSGLDFTVTKGVVSAPLRLIDSVKYIQIDTPVNPGNSGGPIINKAGRIIGIVTSKLAGEGLEGLGFAIRSDTVKDNVKVFIQNDKGETKELDA